MTYIEDTFGNLIEATSFEEAMRLAQAYFEAVPSNCPETPSISLNEAGKKGFAMDAWHVPGRDGAYIGFMNEVYVTIEDAKRLLDSGIATYNGICDSFEDAVQKLAENELDEKEGHVKAYGSWHQAMTYEEAYESCKWHTMHDKDHGLVGLARVADGAYELVAFGEMTDGTAIGMQSDYVSVEDGKRLVAEGVVYEMVLGMSSEELEDPETFEALRQAQFED